MKINNITEQLHHYLVRNVLTADYQSNQYIVNQKVKENKDCTVIKKYIEKGAKVDLDDPIFEQAFLNTTPKIRQALTSGDDFDINATKMGPSRLVVCAINNDAQMMSAVLESPKADINKKYTDINGSIEKSALTCAVEYNSADCLELLLSDVRTDVHQTYNYFDKQVTIDEIEDVIVASSMFSATKMQRAGIANLLNNRQKD